MVFWKFIPFEYSIKTFEMVHASIFFIRSLTYSLGLFLQIVVQNFSLPQRIASFICENVKKILVSENQFDLELCWVIKVCSNFLDILEGTLRIGCAIF